MSIVSIVPQRHQQRTIGRLRAVGRVHTPTYITMFDFGLPFPMPLMRVMHVPYRSLQHPPFSVAACARHGSEMASGQIAANGQAREAEMGDRRIEAACRSSGCPAAGLGCPSAGTPMRVRWVQAAAPVSMSLVRETCLQPALELALRQVFDASL